MHPVTAELASQRKRIIVRFDWDPARLAKVKSIPGRSYTPPERGGPFWTVPLDMPTAKLLRKKFEGEIGWDPNLLAWGREQNRKSSGLQELAHATDYPIEKLKIAKKLPELAEWMRGYQRADTKFLSQTNAINSNQQGLGKTAEIIAAVYEADLEHGPQLVSAPVTSLETVWLAELERFQKFAVLTDEDPKGREECIQAAYELWKEGEPFWLVINPDMIRYEAVKEWDAYKQKWVEARVEEKYPELFKIPWNTITIDEFHKMGLNNPKTLASRALHSLAKNSQRRWAMSGTPLGGKPLKLYGALRFIEPDEHPSMWNWAETWFEVEDDQVFVRGGKGATRKVRNIGALKNEDEFYQHHAKFMLRHLKSEVLPQLPPKQYVDVWCKMTPKQDRQYRKFAADAEVRIDDMSLTATGVLAEYARLKFFASAYCEVEGKMSRCPRCKGRGQTPDGVECDKCSGEGTLDKFKLLPTTTSAKLPYLMERLSGCGIDPKEPSGDACAIVGSQSVEMCEMYHRYLNDQGIPTAILSGRTTKKGERTRLVKAFQNGEYRVLVISTMAGGVSITLDRADSVHIMDETWVPDDQEQLEDRIHRASRIHQVTCYYYRTRGTLEEYIKEVNDEKAFTNESILDTRRQGFRATGMQEAA